MVFFIVVDSINMGINGVESFGGYFFLSGDFQTNIGAVLAFMIYAMVMVGGVMNRRSSKVDVEKN